MVVPRLVILHGTALDALLGYIECDVNQTIFTPFRCENTKLDRIERRARVSARHIGQKIERLVRRLRAIASHALFLVMERPL